MAWAIEFQTDAERDLSLIFDHLYDSYIALGDDQMTAYQRARERILTIQQDAIELGLNPYRGTLRPDFGDHIRNITINNAIIWFDLDEPNETVRILAFFFGRQDHIRHMLVRLLSEKPNNSN